VFTLSDPEAYRGDPSVNVSRAREARLPIETLARDGGLADLSRALAETDGVIDALFGTGLDRPLEGTAARAVRAINESGRPVVAAGVPSGPPPAHGARRGDAR